MRTPKTALLTAIDIAGNQTILAEQLNELLKIHPYRHMRKRAVTQAHIATWLRRGRAAGDMCGVIEASTGVSRTALRPDLFYDVATTGVRS